jgi:acyl-CoA hydrolase
MRRLLDEFEPRRTIYVPGATGEILTLASALAAEPDRMGGVTIVSCLLPGINEFDYAVLDPEARVTTFMLPQALRASFDAGRVRVPSLSYGGIAEHLSKAKIDIAVVHLSPPDVNGLCSFGISSDFSPLAWRAARRRVAVVNPLMHAMQRGPRVSLADADMVVDCESPLIEVPARPASPIFQRIATHAAALIPDGASIQLGIGNAPNAVCESLAGHRDLRIRSGFLPFGVKTLAGVGALASRSTHQVGFAAGPGEFYRYLQESDLVAFGETQSTHDVAALAATNRFHAVNGALEIDLMGQVNVEWQHGQLVGGVGGAPEFVRAALRSRGGRSMLLLPSTSRDGKASRIVPRLSVPSVSMARSDIDTVVTENGAAEVRHLPMDERASALIAVADAVHREELALAWRELRSHL